MIAGLQPKEIIVRAVVYNTDGTVKRDLGVIAHQKVRRKNKVIEWLQSLRTRAAQ